MGTKSLFVLNFVQRKYLTKKSYYDKKIIYEIDW